MSNTIGDKIKCTVFGQSHSEAIGAVIEGLPAGFRPDMERVEQFMRRRAPGTGEHTTKRREPDKPEIISGLVDGATCGAPLCMIIRNTDVRSSDYEKLKMIPRPGHADYTAYVKYGGANDIRGGGQFSGRLTAPLCFAGALCLQLLCERGITVAARIAEIAGVRDKPLDTLTMPDELLSVAQKPFPCVDDEAAEAMLAAISGAKMMGDSVGGVIECYVSGVEAGVGEPMFDGIESAISRAIFGIPAVKGIEFGAGFGSARLRGSENNDPFTVKNGKISCKTNNAGGILGGITNGMPIVFRCAFKPTPSISIPQESVDLAEMRPARLEIRGRHDPCIVPRAVPVVEAVTALTIINLL